MIFTDCSLHTYMYIILDPAQPKGVGKRYLVTSTYKKQAANEISLTQGIIFIPSQTF